MLIPKRLTIWWMLALPCIVFLLKIQKTTLHVTMDTATIQLDDTNVESLSISKTENTDAKQK